MIGGSSYSYCSNGKHYTLSVEFWWEKIEGNLRRANTKPFMEFRMANREPSMVFRRANTKASMDFRRANLEPSMHFRRANTETYYK